MSIALDAAAPESADSEVRAEADRGVLFDLRGVRKTYGAKKIPKVLFRECRLPNELKPRGTDWRKTCGRFARCRQECPKCWALSIDALSIHRGVTTSILGHSGSGKTTLLYLLALLHQPDADSERLRVDFAGDGGGIELTGPGAVRARALDQVRRRRFGFVFQSGHLSSHLTAAQNVALAPALAGEPAAKLRRVAEEILGSVDFPQDRFDALPRHLSGGEYQRVAVARALAADPEVLFADEPTGNLDPVTGRAVMEGLSAWRRGHPSRSLILVTHNLDHALEFSDEIFVLNGGELTLAQPAAGLARRSIEEALRRRSAPTGA
ncbi:MAG: ATP-binding cassette domain-containing protein [Acidobacteriota bacterium]